jgi:glycosyltransferase involved in cell wall biosynthesis
MKIGYLMQEGVPDIRIKPLSGPANHVVSVIRELRQAGHQVGLLARLDKKIYFSDDLEDFNPIEIPFFDKLPYANLFESLRFAFACRQVLSDCDIYFERMGWLGYGGTIACQWQHIPLILEVNGDHIDEFKSRGMIFQENQQRLSYFIMKKMAKYTTHIVASGEGWREKYIDRWGVESSRVSVVENGSSLVDRLKVEELQNFRPVDPEAPMQIAYCGGFEAWYGLPVLIHAVRSAVEAGCLVHVTLIGSGAEQKKILELIQELRLESFFTFTGQMNLDALASQLAQAHVGVAPYCNRVEFSGLKLLDYKAAGLATIVSGQGNQPKIIAQGGTGLIVPPCDEVALSQAIIYLSKNPQRIREMGQQARLEAEQSHRWRNTEAELEKLFSSILTDGNR